MARLPRLYLPGCAQHIIQRGNNREACFYDEADYKAYLSFLKDSAVKCQVAIHAFVLMTDHVHLLVTPGDEKGISRLMQAQGCKYVQYFNHTYDRTDTLWEGRYKYTLGDDRFKAQIEVKTGRRAVPLGRGGDRKSEEYRKAQNQRL